MSTDRRLLRRPSDDEKALLEVRLAAYEREPDAGSSWKEVENRIRSRLKVRIEARDPNLA